MAKKTRYSCRNCGYETYRWLGRCPGCGEWNCITEVSLRGRDDAACPEATAVAPLSEITLDGNERLVTGLSELDRVLGSGAVAGSVILLGGDPGIGKSTLLLQAAAGLAGSEKVLYPAARNPQRKSKCGQRACNSIRICLLPPKPIWRHSCLRPGR